MLHGKLILKFTEAYIHPSVVHFPIALILTGFLIYCIYLFRKRDSRKFALFAYYVLVFAAITAFAASFTGVYYTKEDYADDAMRILIDHRFWAMCTTLMICIAAIIKIFGYLTTFKNVQSYNWPVFVFYSLAVICVIMTASSGTLLTFGYLKNVTFIP